MAKIDNDRCKISAVYLWQKKCCQILISTPSWDNQYITEHTPNNLYNRIRLSVFHIKTNIRSRMTFYTLFTFYTFLIESSSHIVTTSNVKDFSISPLAKNKTTIAILGWAGSRRFMSIPIPVYSTCLCKDCTRMVGAL